MSKIILINRLTMRGFYCSKTEAARKINVSPKTVGTWASSSSSFKMFGHWELFFKVEDIKQDKGFRLKDKNN